MRCIIHEDYNPAARMKHTIDVRAEEYDAGLLLVQVHRVDRLDTKGTTRNTREPTARAAFAKRVTACKRGVRSAIHAKNTFFCLHFSSKAPVFI